MLVNLGWVEASKDSLNMLCYALWVFIDGVIFRETQCLWLEFEKIESKYKSKLLKFLEIVNLSHWNMSVANDVCDKHV